MPRGKDDLMDAVARMQGTEETQQPEQVEEVEESPEEETLEAQESEEVSEETYEEGDDNDAPAEEAEEVGDNPTDEATEQETEDDSDETFYTVKVDGDEYEVNLEELTKGYQLEKNYTTKAQALADERKSMQELRQGLETEQAQYMQLIQQAALQQSAGVQLAKEKLQTIDKNVDPIGFVQAQLEVQELEQGLQAQAQQFQQAQQQQQAQVAQRRGEMQAQAASDLEGMIDGWADETKRSEIQAGVAEFAQSMGYAPEELNNIVSARDIVVLNKARLYDELVLNKQATSGKRKAKIKPKVKSPAPKDKSTVKARQVKDQKAKLRQSGSLKDAAAVLQSRMGK